jgi:hypothetical protein
MATYVSFEPCDSDSITWSARCAGDPFFTAQSDTMPRTTIAKTAQARVPVLLSEAACLSL